MYETYTVMVFPFVPPSNGVGDTPPLPYYLYVSPPVPIRFLTHL